MFFGNKAFKVSLKGRSGIVYSEGGRTAKIEAEIMAGDTDLVIYFSLFRTWEPPSEDDLLADEDRQRIRDNIAKELESKGMTLEWE
jgi:hypothetical protein